MSHTGSNKAEEDRSEFGDVFARAEVQTGFPAAGEGLDPGKDEAGPSVQGIVRDTPGGARGWGRGPIERDERKFKYDTVRARTQAAVAFTASKADRLDASAAGDLLHRIHKMYAIDKEEESRILAFDKALWFEHTINGASLLQPGRGVLTVGTMAFDIAPIKTLLGEDQRRFFRAYADEIAANNREILMEYDAYDPVSVEKVGQIRQVAIERGLQKYPHLAHDSSDACVSISMEERLAVIQSKRVSIPTVNQVDSVAIASAKPTSSVAGA